MLLLSRKAEGNAHPVAKKPSINKQTDKSWKVGTAATNEQQVPSWRLVVVQVIITVLLPVGTWLYVDD